MGIIYPKIYKLLLKVSVYSSQLKHSKNYIHVPHQNFTLVKWTILQLEIGLTNLCYASCRFLCKLNLSSGMIHIPLNNINISEHPLKIDKKKKKN